MNVLTKNGLKELWRATHPLCDGETLHIIDRCSDFRSYVVCHHFDGETWDWGTYCTTLGEAVEIFLLKLKEGGYLPKATYASESGTPARGCPNNVCEAH